MLAAGKLKRRFQLVEVPAKERKPKKVHAFEKDEDGIYRITEKEVPPKEREFDVFMPSGESVRLTMSRLKKLGLDHKPDLYDTETGDIIPIEDVLEEPLNADD